MSRTARRLLWVLATMVRAGLKVPDHILDRCLILGAGPKDGYHLVQAGGTFEHTTMQECPKHPGQVPHFRKYKSDDPFRCIACELESYVAVK